MTTIPYSSAPRPDTGLYNAKLGMWLFLATETMFFGALYSSLVFLRTANAQWPHGPDVLSGGWHFLTLLSVSGSAGFSAQAWAVLRADRGERPRGWLAGTSICGLLSVLFIALSQVQVAHGGVTPATSNFYGMYFLLSGLHLLHALAGVGLTGYALLRGNSLLLRDATAYMNRLECLGFYWQFLALHWVVLMLSFFVLG